MNNTNAAGGLTRKEIIKATGCPPYLVTYYTTCGYLPVLHPSTGPGDPVIYHPDAVDVIQGRMARRRREMIEGGLSRK